MWLVPQTPQILAKVPFNTFLVAWLFGVMWGVGGRTFGLTMRYLGNALAYAIALELCVAFGTLNGRMIMDDRYKYCIYESGQLTESLVDLKQDSGEMKNLAYLPDSQKKIVERLRGKLKQWSNDNEDTIGMSYFQRS